MKSFTLLLSLAFSLGATLVNAHGYVQNMTIDGTVYTGYLPFSDPYDVPIPQRIFQHIPDDGPVLDITSTNLTCNVGGQTAAGATASAKGGSTITWTMVRWPTDHHGPVTVYMASCGADCNTFDGSGDVWFKIDQGGLINATAQYWASDYLIANDLSWTANIPETIKPGQYLLRFELLALHDAGAPQFYPSCAQLDITSSSGTDVPAANEVVSIPGVYKQGDPAIDGDIWDAGFTTWPIDGPPIAKMAANSAVSSKNLPAPPSNVVTSGDSTPVSASSSTKPSSTTSATASSKPRVCKKKRSVKPAAQKKKRALSWHAVAGPRSH